MHWIFDAFQCIRLAGRDVNSSIALKYLKQAAKKKNAMNPNESTENKLNRHEVARPRRDFVGHAVGRGPSAAVLVVLLAVATIARADELAETGKAIFKKNQRAVVTVQLVLKSKFSMAGLGNQSNESRQDVTGTVVDGSGLTILSLSATDPG